jgi:hypothetical protein
MCEYRLDYQGSIPRRCKMIFPLASVVQTSSEAHSASSPVGTRGPIVRCKAQPGHDTTHPHLVLRSRMSRNYISSPPWCWHGGSGTAYFYFLVLKFYMKIDIKLSYRQSSCKQSVVNEFSPRPPKKDCFWCYYCLMQVILEYKYLQLCIFLEHSAYHHWFYEPQFQIHCNKVW